MSYAAEGYLYPGLVGTPDLAAADPTRRSIYSRLLFLLPVLFSGVSYAGGGIAMVTDLAFVTLTILCVIFLCRELLMFPKRQGMGGILIYGGVLVWFCHDYFWNWFFRDFNNPNTPVSAYVVSKAAFYHCLFIEVMLIGLNARLFADSRLFNWAEKLVVAVPEPSTNLFYLALVIITMVIGLSPFTWAVQESFIEAIGKVIMLDVDDMHWLVGRTVTNFTTNVNYNWGGYILQIFQVGEIGGILGAAYAILVTRWIPAKIFGWACWAFWCCYAFPSLRRGDITFMVLPVAGFFFYKYQIQAAGYLRKLGIKAYLFGGIVAIGLFIAVQYQGSTRAGVEGIELFEARGNTMFSEGIKAWAYFPDETGGFFYDTFPGAGIIRPIPQTLFWFLIDPIPRALWNNKPVDEFGAWYDDYMTGEHLGAAGTTVSGGAVGTWYYQYGPCGVIEGALLYGWLMAIAERSLQKAKGSTMAVLFSLCFATFMFRSYRDLWFHNLYPVMIAAAVMYPVARLFSAPKPQVSEETPIAS